MLFNAIPVEKIGFSVFPESGMFFIKSLDYCFHDSFPQKSGFVFDSVTAAVNIESPDLSIIEHQRKPVGSFQSFFLI